MTAKAAAYIELTKPKVTLLNVLVGVTCFVIASNIALNWFNLGLFAVVGYLAAGGCGVLNCVYDANIDKQMARTSRRAIPSGVLSSKSALIYGLILETLSLVIAYFFFNVLTTIMVALGIVTYLLVYTVLLKRASPWNVVIGGAAGCFAALSGWTATGAALTWVPLAISLIDFLWTPGHLWGLAIKKVNEYRQANIPMLPVVTGVRKASAIVFWLNTSTVIFSLLLPIFSLTGTIYTVIALCAGAIFLIHSRKLLTSPSGVQGFKAFLASMPYLMCLMVALMIDKMAITIF